MSVVAPARWPGIGNAGCGQYLTSTGAGRYNPRFAKPEQGYGGTQENN